MSVTKMRHLSKIFGFVLIFAVALQAQIQKTDDGQILLNITVTSKTGGWITGLKAENFKVYDKKKIQPITFFSAEDVPVSVGILVDKSESADLIEAPVIEEMLTGFVSKSHPENEYFLMTFNMSQEILLAPTQDNKAVSQAIQKLQDVKFEGNTKFFDAVAAGLEKISKGKHAKKVLIILSDAIDNSSKNDFKDLEKLIKQTDVLLYNINVMPPEAAASITGMQAQSFSEELTELSGGRTIMPETMAELHKVFSQLAEEIRSQYTVGIKTDKTKKKEKWRELEIKVELPPDSASIGKTYVRTRKGYY